MYQDIEFFYYDLVLLSTLGTLYQVMVLVTGILYSKALSVHPNQESMEKYSVSTSLIATQKNCDVVREHNAKANIRNLDQKE